MTTVDELLAEARSELGYTECQGHSHTGRNHTKFAAEAGHANGAAWCATFIVALARRCGIELPSESAYTPSMANGFKAAKRWHTSPQPGDVVFFDFPDSKNRIQHVGIYETSTSSTNVVCIEGNTSPGAAGSQDNGGGVYRRTRPRSHVVGYGRPLLTPSVATPPQEALVDKFLIYWIQKPGVTHRDAFIADVDLMTTDPLSGPELKIWQRAGVREVIDTAPPEFHQRFKAA